MATNEGKKKSPNARHCAFCLGLKPHKLCTGCHRRAYCSVDCQKEDWKPSGKGQGHKNYCKIEQGQEDVDWEVKPVPGKGLGVIAKRPIPAMYRIIIEGVQQNPTSHPGIFDLMPEDGTLDEKFFYNSVIPPGSKSFGVGLRYSRMNHSCTPNASLVYCHTTNVFIVYACRDIKEGEEICRNYTCINEMLTPQGTMRKISNAKLSIGLELVELKLILAMRGISCPDDCVCSKPSYEQNYTKLRKLNKFFEQHKRKSPSRALEAVEEMLPLMATLNVSLRVQSLLHHEASKISLDNPALRSIGLMHVKAVSEIQSAILPLSEQTAQHNEIIKRIVKRYSSGKSSVA